MKDLPEVTLTRTLNDGVRTSNIAVSVHSAAAAAAADDDDECCRKVDFANAPPANMVNVVLGLCHIADPTPPPPTLPPDGAGFTPMPIPTGMYHSYWSVSVSLQQADT